MGAMCAPQRSKKQTYEKKLEENIEQINQEAELVNQQSEKQNSIKKLHDERKQQYIKIKKEIKLMDDGNLDKILKQEIKTFMQSYETNILQYQKSLDNNLGPDGGQYRISKEQFNLQQPRQLDLEIFQKDQVLQKLMSFRTKYLVNEKMCQPISFFPLKNSDEFLWEDQTNQLNHIQLITIKKITNTNSFTLIQWQGNDIKQHSKQYLIQIITLNSLEIKQLYEFENEYYYFRYLVHKLHSQKQTLVTSDIKSFYHMKQIFRVQYSYNFVRVTDYPMFTLKKIIQIRRRKKQPYEEQEIIAVMLSLLMAIQVARTIEISHGNINDENIYITDQETYQLKGFEEIRIKYKIKSARNDFKKKTNLILQQKYIEIQQQIKSSIQDEQFPKEDVNDDISNGSEKEMEDLNHSKKLKSDLIISQQSIKYHFYKESPHNSIYWNQRLLPIYKRALKKFHSDNYENQIFKHEEEKYKFTGTDSEIEIQEIVLQKDIYSILVIALQMISLGDYEKSLCRKPKNDIQHQTKGIKAKKNDKQNINPSEKVYAQIAKKMFGMDFKIENEIQQLNIFKNKQNRRRSRKYFIPDEIDRIKFFRQYEVDYSYVINLIEKIYKSDEINLDQLIDELIKKKSAHPNERKIYDQYLIDKHNLKENQVHRKLNQDKIKTQKQHNNFRSKTIKIVKSLFNQDTQHKQNTEVPVAVPLPIQEKEEQQVKTKTQKIKNDIEVMDQIILIDQQDNNSANQFVRNEILSQQIYANLRKKFYTIMGYMLICNYKFAHQQINELNKQLEEQVQQIQQKDLIFFKITNPWCIFFSDSEQLIIQLMNGISLLERRKLDQARQIFINLELQISSNSNSIENDKIITPLTTRFYLGFVYYIQGQVNEALIEFDRIQEMVFGKLLNLDPIGYFQLQRIVVLLHQDGDRYFEAFKLLKEWTNYEDFQKIKYNYITMDYVLSYFNLGKAYFEVSQFVFSYSYFLKSVQLLREQQNLGNEDFSIKLRILGYLCYLSFLLNDMENLSQYLQESISLMKSIQRREQYLETAIIWLNQFGFLLGAQLNNEELFQFIEVYDITIQKNEKTINIDIFFKNYVFAKLYYFCRQNGKSERLFLDALEMHQYYFSDKLRQQQTNNISQNQIKLINNERIDKLNKISKIQQLGGITLPPPQKNNLTVRIIIEIYDWLGYIYTQQKETAKAEICYNQHKEMAYNLINFDSTQKDEYMLRIAKILFFQKKYKQSLEIFQELSVDISKQQVDDFLRFEYNQISASIQIWICNIHYILNQDHKGHQAYQFIHQEIYLLCNKNGYLMAEIQDEIQRKENNFKQKQNNQSSQQKINTSYKQIILEQNILQAQEEERLHQASIIILILQLSIQLSIEFLLMGMKKQALKCLEESLKRLEYDVLLNSSYFKNVISISLKMDLFVLLGHLYYLNGIKENSHHYLMSALHYLQQIKHDQFMFEKINLMYDQIAKCAANLCYLKSSLEYFNHSMKKNNLNKDTSETQLAFKLANIGAIQFKLNNYAESLQSTNQAIRQFSFKYDKMSVTIQKAKFKQLEIMIETPNSIMEQYLIKSKSKDPSKQNPKFNIIRKLICILKINIKQPNNEVYAQIFHLIAKYYHKIESMDAAYEYYIKQFLLVIRDWRKGQQILIQFQQNRGLKEIQLADLAVNTADRTALLVLLDIAQLLFDQIQYQDCFHLINNLVKIFYGRVVAPNFTLQDLQILGLQYQYTQNFQMQGFISNFPQLTKLVDQNTKSNDTNSGQITYYQFRLQEILSNFQNRQDTNLLAYAHSLKLKNILLVNWAKKIYEPFLYEEYQQIINRVEYSHNFSKFYDKYSKGFFNEESDQDYRNILIELKNSEDMLIDNLIIYNETLGDRNINFLEVLIQYVEFKYLQEESNDQFDKNLQFIRNQLEEVNEYKPYLLWQVQLLQAKRNMQKNLLIKMAMLFKNTFYLQSDSEDTKQMIVSLQKLNNYELKELYNNWMIKSKDDLYIRQEFLSFIDKQSQISEINQIHEGIIKNLNKAKQYLQDVQIGIDSHLKNQGQSSQYHIISEHMLQTYNIYNYQIKELKILLESFIPQQ